MQDSHLHRLVLCLVEVAVGSSGPQAVAQCLACFAGPLYSNGWLEPARGGSILGPSLAGTAAAFAAANEYSCPEPERNRSMTPARLPAGETLSDSSASHQLIFRSGFRSCFDAGMICLRWSRGGNK